MCICMYWVIDMPASRPVQFILKAVRDVLKRYDYCDAARLSVQMGISLSTAYQYLRKLKAFIEKEGEEYFDIYFEGGKVYKKEGKK